MPEPPTLAPFAEGVWIATRPQRFYGVETGTRMTVARMADGGLFVHCPTALDGETRRAVDGLGEVRAVVAASLFHHLYVGEWMQAYPRASFHPCPGLARKRPDLAWGPTLGAEPDPTWSADLDQAPLTSRLEREVVFFHRATRTFICADALLNLSTHPSRGTRAVAFLMGNDAPGTGYIERFMVRDWALGREQVDRILQWNVEGIVLAHGDLVPRGGREAIAHAYR